MLPTTSRCLAIVDDATDEAGATVRKHAIGGKHPGPIQHGNGSQPATPMAI